MCANIIAAALPAPRRGVIAVVAGVKAAAKATLEAAMKAAHTVLALLGGALLAGCAAFAPAPEAPPPGAAVTRALPLVLATAGGELVRVDARAPSRVLARVALRGLPPGEALVGIDYRVAHGKLYALTRSGRLFTLDAATGQATPVAGAAGGAIDRAAQSAGAGAAAVVLSGLRFGFDFNPVPDRIRVAGDDRQNLRLHPDSGALAAADPALVYAAGDIAFGRTPVLGGAAYTYNKRDDKLTTNFAIDLAAGTLVTQGSREGVQPVVSPNTGQLFTVGPLGLGPLQDAAFDIADVDNTALAAVRRAGVRGTQLVRIDLATGRAVVLGRLGSGEPLRGLAIEP